MAEHYFSVLCLGISQKLLKTNQFLVSAIFFTIMNIFIQPAFWSFFNHCQRSQSNQEQCSLCCNSPCFRVLLCTHYEPLQCFSTSFRKLKEIGVLRPLLPDYVISCGYDSLEYFSWSQTIYFKSIVFLFSTQTFKQNMLQYFYFRIFNAWYLSFYILL